jgi:hypothetical protein
MELPSPKKERKRGSHIPFELTIRLERTVKDFKQQISDKPD